MTRDGKLTAEQLGDLADQFQLETGDGLLSSGAVRTMDLLDTRRCSEYLDELGGTLGSPNRMITASLFAKRYAFLAAAPSLYALTVYSKGLDMALHNCRIERASPESPWPIRFRLRDLSVTEPAAGNRQEWRDETVRSLFADHLATLWRALHEASGVPIAVLWENMAVRFYSLYEKRLDCLNAGNHTVAGNDDQLCKRITDDYEYLIRQAPGHLFGERRNPLGRFYNRHRTGLADAPDNRPIRIRSTCCFNYEVDRNGSFCSNCPKKKQESPRVQNRSE